MPGVRLMALLENRLTDILDKERDNRCAVHLYNIGTYWVAFERSAYQLYRLFPRVEPTSLSLTSYPFPFVMASITDRSLHAYACEHIVRRSEAGYVRLTAPDLLLADYRKWHAKEAESLPTM